MKTNTSTRCTSLSLLSLFLLLASGLAHAVATVPDGINYQGLLTDAQGNPVKPDGTYTLEFRLWSEDNVLVWGRKFDVTVVSGQFNAILNDGGEANVLTGAPETKLIDAFAAPNRFLGITIAAAPPEITFSKEEIKPRQKILNAPYAIQAEKAAFAANAGLVGNHDPYFWAPRGIIVAYGGSTAPEGWLLCDNSKIPDGSQYDALRQLLGAENTPDLRGYFIRGLDPRNQDDAEGLDPDRPRKLESPQKDAFQGHIHRRLEEKYNIQDFGIPAYTSSAQYAQSKGFADNAACKYTGAPYALEGYGTIRFAKETRPINRSFNYIIKY